MATVTLSKLRSKYSVDSGYCRQVGQDARLTLKGHYLRDVGQLSATVESPHLV